MWVKYQEDKVEVIRSASYGIVRDFTRIIVLGNRWPPCPWAAYGVIERKEEGGSEYRCFLRVVVTGGEGKVAGKEGRIYTESSPLLLHKDRWTLATHWKSMKGILWFVERVILERKPIFIKFRKLVKNWRKKKNAGDSSGKEMRTHREGETMNEGEQRWKGTNSLFRVQFSASLSTR